MLKTQSKTNWKKVRLAELFDIQQGKQVSKSNRVGINLRPFLRTANVFWGKLDISKLDYMNFTDKEQKRFELQKGDLLLCEGGDIGRTAIWNGELSGCYYQNHLHRLRKLNKNINEYFVLYYLQYAFVFKKLYSGRANITTIPNLSKSRLGELEIPLPQLAEQENIAKILLTLQKVIDSQEELIAKLIDLKRSLMRELYTYGINKENTKLTNIGEIPASWHVVAVEDLGKVVTGSTPNTKLGQYYLPAEIDFITPGDIDDTKYIYQTERKISPIGFEAGRPIPKDSICCVCIGSSIGKVAKSFKSSTTNQQINTIICNENYDSDFVYYLMLFYSDYWRNHATFGPVPLLSKGAFNKIKVPVSTNKLEQKKIGNILSSVDLSIEANESKLIVYQNLFKTLLTNLMSGEMKVNNSNQIKQNPKEVFKDAVVQSYLVKNIASPYVSHICLEKTTYFTKRFAGVSPISTYGTYTFGPYDPLNKYKGGLKLALNKKLIEPGDSWGYKPGRNISEIESYLYYSEISSAEKALSKLNGKSDSELEILATVDFSIFDLLSKKIKPTSELILNFINSTEAWREKTARLKLDTAKVSKAMEQLRKLAVDGLPYPKIS